MILDKIYVSNTEPSATNILWAKPIDGGAFALYAFISGKWGVLKLMNDNGTPYPDDDTPGGSADDCYTKEEIDSKLADILGLDAEGVAELKALIEDDDALTGLLGELKDEVKSVEVFHYLQGSHKPLPVGKYNYTISGLINVPKNVYNEGNYLIFRYPEDITTNSFHYLVFEEKTVGEVTGYFCVHSYSPSSEPPAWVEDVFGYTRSEANNLLNDKVDKEQGKGLSSNDYTTEEKTKVANIPTALSQLTEDATHRTVSDVEKNTWNNKGNITGITMNGVSKGTSGVVDLGTVLTTVATLVQEANLNPVTSDAVYKVLNSIELIISAALNDLKDSIPENVSDLTNDSGFISSVKTINGNAITGTGDVSVGTITGITMNNVYKGTSGVVNLGTVLTSTTASVTNGSGLPITSGGVYTALQGYETKLAFTTISTTSYTASKNTYHRHTNTPSSLAITLPASPTSGDTCVFSFTTSSSFTSTGFSISGNGNTVTKMKDFEIGASKIYELIALYNGSVWLLTYTEFK